ncbi:hypothetical protein JXM83_02540 [Candidatus Woesearchaeota archaeon]|nr:hypothetical protein [Candidatus Woesearchaeota archaeon]
MRKEKYDINNFYLSHTKQVSDLCRKVVFGLFALGWAISFHNGKIAFDISVLITFIFLLVYITLDVLQYLAVSRKLKKSMIKVDFLIKRNLIDKYRLDEKENDNCINDVDNINKAINLSSYRLFTLKLIILLISFLSSVIMIILRIMKDCAN